MTEWFEKFRQRSQMRHLVAQSREIASRCQADAWDRVRAMIFDMDLPEARGYVRARCAVVVRRHLAGQDAAKRLRPASHDLLVALTTEHMVHRVIAELVTTRPVAHRAAA